MKDILGHTIHPKIGEWYWFTALSGDGPYEGKIRKKVKGKDFWMFDMPPTRGIWFGYPILGSVNRDGSKKEAK